MTKPPARVFLHREYLDPRLAPFGEKHLQQLRYLHSTGLRYFNKAVATNRYIALLKISGDHLHVMLLPRGELYFEFFTSGKPLRYWTFTQGSITGQGYFTGVIGVTSKGSALTPKLRTGERVQHTLLEASRIRRGQQVILLDEPVHYYSETQPKTANYPRQLYDAWAPLHPHSGLHFRSYHTFFQSVFIHTLLGSYSAHYLRDIGYDAVWGDNTEFDPLREAALTSSNTDWPRQTGAQQVKSTLHGAREFAIYVDAFDQVSVFPTAKIVEPLTAAAGAPLQNVDPMYVKTVRVTFPAWVYKKNVRFKDWFSSHPGAPGDIATGVYEFPEIDWKLGPASDKMCAVVYERIEAQFDAAYYAPYATDIGSQGPGTYYPDTTSFNLMNSATMGVAALHGGAQALGVPFYQSAPGLLEVLIEVEITGPNPEDFSVSLTTGTVRRPTTSPYCTLLAGYVWHDVRAKGYTTAAPKYDARRGDLCVLDIECYGNLTTGKAADLYSLKNISTVSTEIRTFGASSGFSAGAMFKSMPSILAADMRTLSFVFKYRNDVRTDGPPPKIEQVFGVSVYVMNKWRQTFYPSTLPEAHKAIIASKVDSDQRTAMNSELPGLTLMPLNDLRDWTDADLAALRERYTRMLTKANAQWYGPYAGNPAPYGNPDISTTGYKFWKTGSYALTPSPAAQNWYTHVVRHGLLQPYVLFDLVTPRPGWWQYTGQIIQRVEINPHTTFFTHPNGSWAFFNQDMLYNGNGIPVINIGVPGLGTSGWDAAKMEHCIFDQVNLVDGRGTARVSSFLKLYNQAIKDGRKQGVITDDTVEIALADLKATFVPGTSVDPYDPTLVYAQMRIDWPVGYQAYYRELAYFTGTKGGAGGTSSFDGSMLGGALDLSLSALWKKTAAYGSILTAPNTANTPYTFSTCVLITK